MMLSTTEVTQAKKILKKRQIEVVENQRNSLQEEMLVSRSSEKASVIEEHSDVRAASSCNDEEGTF